VVAVAVAVAVAAVVIVTVARAVINTNNYGCGRNFSAARN